MSGSKVIGPGAAAGGAAMLPVTGSPTMALLVAGLGAVIAGLLLLRFARYSRRG